MPKEKFMLEFDMKSTPVPMLWSYIATANGLKEWFADSARANGKEIIFEWNGVEQSVLVVGTRTEKYIRYHWTEETDKLYFELRISISELTDNTILTVTDYVEPEEASEAKNLWCYQVETLQRLLGC